jgi:fatty acid desaturase
MSYSHDFHHHHHHQTTTPSSSPSYDGRMAFRTRPRRLMLLLFAAVFLTIVLFSRHEPTQSYGASLGFAPQAPHDVASLARLHPVVFALIMYSEASAMEGAILVKVTFFFFITRLEVE